MEEKHDTVLHAKGNDHSICLPFEYGTSRLGIDCGGVLTVTDTDAQARGSRPKRGKTTNEVTSTLVDGAASDCDEEDASGAINITAPDNLCSSMQRHPPSARCVFVVAQLVRKFGANNVFIVSKCGGAVQRATVIWMHRWNFFRQTGLRPENVRFCVNRTGIEGETIELKWNLLTAPEGQLMKAMCEAPGCDALCEEQVRSYFCGPQIATAAKPYEGFAGNVGKGVVASDLGLTHFIDDRVECLHSVFFEGGFATRCASEVCGALLHFGEDASELKAKPAQDHVLPRLLKPVGRAQCVRKPAIALPTPEALWTEMTDAHRDAWPRFKLLRECAPVNPRTKPKPEEIEVLRRFKCQEKELKAELGAECWKSYLAYEKALARPALPAEAAETRQMTSDAAGMSPSEIEARTRAKWISPEADLFWSQRLAANYVCEDWDAVARLFNIDI